MAQAAPKIDAVTSLSELILTEERITQTNIPIEELFMLDYDNAQYGPIWLQDLKKTIEYYPDLYEKGQLRALGSDDAIEVWKHPRLARRRPQVVAGQETKATPFLEDSLFFVRKNGQEFGPYNYSEIIDRVMENKIGLTDSYSIDGGKTWERMHAIPTLDRRQNLGKGKLPAKRPEHLLAEGPQGIILKPFTILPRENRKTPSKLSLFAATGLLTVAKQAAGQIITSMPRIITTRLQGHLPSDLGTKSKPNFVKIGAVAGGGLLFLGILTWSFTQYMGNKMHQDQTENGIQDESEGNNNSYEAVPNNDSSFGSSGFKNNNSGLRRVKNRAMEPSSRSFENSAAFRRSKRLDHDNSSNEYDSLENPVEQDEVRRKLSRDTINPHPPGVDAEGRDIIEPARDPSTFQENMNDQAQNEVVQEVEQPQPEAVQEQPPVEEF